MYTIYFKGGLGNQLFQLAYAYYLANGEINKLMFNTSLLNYDSFKNTKRQFALSFIQKQIHSSFLSALKIKLKLSSRKILRDINLISDNRTNNFLNKINYDICGYFQDDLLYLDCIEKDFSEFINTKLNNINCMKKLILPCNDSISIHIRRGDYVNNIYANQVHKVIDLDYYIKAINILKKNNTVFYIFSDDIEWVKKNIISNTNINYKLVSNLGINDVEEFFIMSKCRNNIISNSTYSWWAAFLNTNNDKKIISPSSWFNDNRPFPKLRNAIYI